MAIVGDGATLHDRDTSFDELMQAVMDHLSDEKEGSIPTFCTRGFRVSGCRQTQNALFEGLFWRTRQVTGVHQAHLDVM